MFTIEEFYYQVHQQVTSLNSNLDDFLPIDLKPLASTSLLFKTKIVFKSEIDEDLKLKIENYLYKVFYTIGKKFFIEIVFCEQQLDSTHYFESFSDFNSGDIDLHVDKVKMNLEKCVNDSKLTCVVSTLTKNYNYQDSLLKNYFEMIDEIYNLKLKSLICKRENLKMILKESKIKLDDVNKQYGEKIIKNAKALYEKTNVDLYELSNKIDTIYIEYKIKFIKIYEMLIEAIKKDIERVNNPQFSSFANLRLQEYVTKFFYLLVLLE